MLLWYTVLAGGTGPDSVAPPSPTPREWLESVDAADLKSVGVFPRVGSTPTSRTKQLKGEEDGSQRNLL